MQCSEHTIFSMEDFVTNGYFNPNPCSYCTYYIDEVCDLFSAFDETGVDFNLISFDYPLPDFKYNGDFIEWL